MVIHFAELVGKMRLNRAILAMIFVHRLIFNFKKCSFKSVPVVPVEKNGRKNFKHKKIKVWLFKWRSDAVFFLKKLIKNWIFNKKPNAHQFYKWRSIAGRCSLAVVLAVVPVVLKSETTGDKWRCNAPCCTKCRNCSFF